MQLTSENKGKCTFPRKTFGGLEKKAYFCKIINNNQRGNDMKNILDKAFRGKRVLVTGHTGFKGSWLAIWLHEMGAQVIGVALDPATERDNYVLSGIGQKIEADLRADIRDGQRLKDIFSEYQPEVVFHLAAQPLVRLSYDIPVETYETNVMGTIHVMEAIRQMKWEMGRNAVCVHLTYVPYLKAAGELKTKPTQHSVKELQSVGIQPDILVLRTEKHLGKDILEKGFVQFHENDGILIGLINLYIDSKDDTGRLFDLIHAAQNLNPTNASLFYVEGNVYKQLGDIENAAKYYSKSVEVDPNYTYGPLGLGALYYDKAIELQTKASEELDDNKYFALVKEMDETLEKAIAPFEQSFKMTDDAELKSAIAEYLKNIYFRLRDKNPEYEALSKKYEAFLKGE